MTSSSGILHWVGRMDQVKELSKFPGHSPPPPPAPLSPSQACSVHVCYSNRRLKTSVILSQNSYPFCPHYLSTLLVHITCPHCLSTLAAHTACTCTHNLSAIYTLITWRSRLHVVSCRLSALKSVLGQQTAKLKRRYSVSDDVSHLERLKKWSHIFFHSPVYPCRVQAYFTL